MPSKEPIWRADPKRRASFEILGRILRNLRKEAGLDQADLAKRMGYSQAAISKMEHGERRVFIADLYHYCDALGITLTDVIARFERNMRRWEQGQE